MVVGLVSVLDILFLFSGEDFSNDLIFLFGLRAMIL